MQAMTDFSWGEAPSPAPLANTHIVSTRAARCFQTPSVARSLARLAFVIFSTKTRAHRSWSRWQGHGAEVGRRRPPLRLGFLLVFALVANPARAAFEVKDEGWEGCSRLLALAREELGREHVEALATLDYSRLTPNDALLILHPEVEIRFEPLAAFLTGGGRAAIVDDYGEAPELFERFHIRRTNSTAQPAITLRENGELAVARPALEGAQGGARHPTLRGVQEVVTNHPTGLLLEPGVELTPLLTIPGSDGSSTLLAVTGVIGNAEACGLTASSTPGAAATGHCGRLVAMGDPSVFINLMLQHPGNAAFARGLVGYLLEDDSWGSRRGKLYILSGSFAQVGSFAGSGGLAEFWSEQRAALMHWLDEIERQSLPEPLNIALGALAALGVAAWAGFAGAQLYLRPRPTYARPLPLAAQGGFAGRFAVLAAKAADRALVVLELKRAFEATLRERLGLPAAASSAAIMSAAQRDGRLSAQGVRSLERVLSRLGRAEVALVNVHALRVSDRQLDSTGSEMLEVLVEMHQDQRDVMPAGAEPPNGIGAKGEA
jgi:hypothetical protein